MGKLLMQVNCSWALKGTKTETKMEGFQQNKKKTQAFVE